MGDSDETATIEALSRQFSEAVRARDFTAIGGMYTNDAVICPPNSNILIGKGNIQQFWQRNRVIQEISFDSISVKSLGENALRAVGTMTLQLLRPNAPAEVGRSQQIKAKYVLVWQKVEGAWKIDSGIWNRIGPVQTRGFPAPSAIRAGGFGQGGGPRGPGLGPGGGPRGSGMGGGGQRSGARGIGPGGGPRQGGVGRFGPPGRAGDGGSGRGPTEA